MIRFEQLKNKPALLLCLTGLNLAAFMELLPGFGAAYEADLEQRDQQRPKRRQRRRGAGQKGALPKLEDKLVFILFYFKRYPVQRAQGFFFGMGQPQANEWVHRLTPILNRALGYEMQLPARERKDIEQILSECPGTGIHPGWHRAPHPATQSPSTSERPLQWQAEAPHPQEQRRDRQAHSQGQSLEPDGGRQAPR